MIVSERVLIDGRARFLYVFVISDAAPGLGFVLRSQTLDPMLFASIIAMLLSLT